MEICSAFEMCRSRMPFTRDSSASPVFRDTSSVSLISRGQQMVCVVTIALLSQLTSVADWSRISTRR